MTDPPPLLAVDGLRVSVDIGGTWREVVRGVSFRRGQGETIGLVGESGSGKTLTVSPIARLLPPAARATGGSVQFRGEDLLRAAPRRLAQLRGKDIGMVFQDSLTSLNPIMRIGTQVGGAVAAAPHDADRVRRRSRAEAGCADSAFPTRSGRCAAIRTSSPAACASAR